MTSLNDGEPQCKNFVQQESYIEKAVEQTECMKYITDNLEKTVAINEYRNLHNDKGSQDLSEFSDSETSGSIYVPSIASDSSDNEQLIVPNGEQFDNFDVGKVNKTYSREREQSVHGIVEKTNVVSSENVSVVQPTSSKVTFNYLLINCMLENNLT